MYFALIDSLRSYLAFLQLGQKQERGLAGEDFLVRAQNGATNVCLLSEIVESAGYILFLI